MKPKESTRLTGSGRVLLFAASLALVSPGAALAQSDNTGPDELQAVINGRVPPLCRLGPVTTANGEFAMGTLTAPATAYLRRDLRAPDQVLEDSWCNAPSRLEVSAIEMTPQGAVARLREGFSAAVHFTATASGWTDQPAVFRTDVIGQQSSASKLASRPRVVALVIGVSDFRMLGGPTVRPIASRSYLGAVIVKLTPVP